MKIFDVAVVGGGIAGASFAYRVAGHRSLVLLEAEAQVGYHSTGRSAAEFSRQFQNETTGLLADASYDFLANPPEGFADVPLLIPRGNLVIASEERLPKLDAAFREVIATSAQSRPVSIEEAIAMVPFLRPDYMAGAFYDPACWDMEVESILQGYLRGARRNGADIRTGSPVSAVERDGGIYRLQTPQGPILARRIVNTAGAWADRLAVLAGLAPLGIVPHRRTAITVDVPADYDLAPMPGVNEVDEDFYFKPEAGKLMVSPADATPSDPCDAQPEDIDVAYAAHFLEQSTTLPVKTISHKWAGLRSFTADKLQVVGSDRNDPDFFWLAGQGGSGILTSPALSEWAAGLFLDGTPPERLVDLGLEPGIFSPRRLAR
ncbi:MAG: FAD-binding oxidoreductase [Alphaproteobacteria bacterium]|nr:FAD-binding oxidoreductase [Rhizobiaceae bacterium]MBU3959633.1 FAD-binding oxidoreductase [Alphaproteobacteria bacterium]MBU4051454.1 FAD-binding oxidoreductase [Alphaproteobacteria bacterium]MBU4087954.1 FAD-binding oxidoreductase [Alphaproteobacteria bacterium]MBU4156210.1 FAD-binding oxidoreductase [Alphaproteobacteria bacterium]